MTPNARSLVDRLLDEEDREASSDFAAEFFPRLVGALRRKHPGEDPHLVQEAAGQAIVGVIKNPRQYNPALRSLDSFLFMAAECDLRNARARERRRRNGRVFVELDELPGNSPLGDGTPLRLEDFPGLAATRDALPGPDRAVLNLMLLGERRTAAFAEALGLGGRPVAEQRRLVKRAKDRILKRLQRAGGKT